MKKLLCILSALAIALSLAVPAAAENIDLTALSWEELLELKEKITLEQMSRDEWQEVEVQQGVYVVGEDIPAGKWTIKSFGNGRWSNIAIGSKLSENGNGLDIWENYTSYYIYNPDHRNFEEGDCTEVTITLQEGYYVEIENYGNPVLFCTPTGNSFGFK